MSSVMHWSVSCQAFIKCQMSNAIYLWISLDSKYSIWIESYNQKCVYVSKLNFLSHDFYFVQATHAHGLDFIKKKLRNLRAYLYC